VAPRSRVLHVVASIHKGEDMLLALSAFLVWYSIAQELEVPGEDLRSSNGQTFVVYQPRERAGDLDSAALMEQQPTLQPPPPPPTAQGEELQIDGSTSAHGALETNQPSQSTAAALSDQASHSSRRATPMGAACADSEAEMTGFEVHTNEGFLRYAACEDLLGYCHNWVNSSIVQTVCPVTCFICDPSLHGYQPTGPPCYDMIVTGVRFKNGPEATCLDLASYCTHSTLFYHVQAACRMTCGLCEAHIGHVEGDCVDAASNEAPEFMINGALAACTDLMDFCQNHPDSYLIRHKCPITCGACPEVTTSTHSSFQTSKEATFDDGQDPSDCQRRRRWGFCATRRRRNL